MSFGRFSRQGGSAVELIPNASLNSLANNTIVAGSAINFSTTFAAMLYLEIEVTFQYASTPASNSVLDGWFLGQNNNTNYEDGGAGVTPARAPDFVIPTRVSSDGQRILLPLVWCPPDNRIVLLRNNGSGQALVSSGNYITARGITITG